MGPDKENANDYLLIKRRKIEKEGKREQTNVKDVGEFVDVAEDDPEVVLAHLDALVLEAKGIQEDLREESEKTMTSEGRILEKEGREERGR